MPFELSSNQVERWRLIAEDYRSDTAFQEQMREYDRNKEIARQGILGLLNQYLSGEVDLEQFRSTFDRKTRKEWDIAGFKGMSGAMVLNVLVKHLVDTETLDHQLKEVLRAPTDEADGRRKMQVFVDYLEGLIESGVLSRRVLQPARTAFFATAFWHVQNPNEWPVFFPVDRRTLEAEGLYAATGDPVVDYFAFRQVIQSLSAALQLDVREVQHVIGWLDDKKASRQPAERTQPPPIEVVETTGQEEPVSSPHIQAQWMLAKIGKKAGCRVWVAANDQNKQWRGERLGDLSVKTLPSLGMDTESQRVISLIDVLWIRGTNQVIAAFEVEHTTSIYSGLLRMSDLTVLSPNLNFPLYIVAPQERLDQVRRELSRPTFQFLELHRRCGFFSSEELAKEFDSIMRWANDPSVIEGLASKVGEIPLTAA